MRVKQCVELTISKLWHHHEGQHRQLLPVRRVIKPRACLVALRISAVGLTQQRRACADMGVGVGVDGRVITHYAQPVMQPCRVLAAKTGQGIGAIQGISLVRMTALKQHVLATLQHASKAHAVGPEVLPQRIGHRR